ncbi:unnamed protein product [Chondrus crispus]|uniref:Uncharacterized protein n=1 Tax=Chondrus crispus TaxID=2769 RepID=R7QS69_CHOCR|nr:unnamed protein product [Chondrus crispus]CDF40230.1 unnamed protein product [Chondrus crispus]|eukprot:XP_005710524.1 unnamed protein product [Chondrus crispus]
MSQPGLPRLQYPNLGKFECVRMGRLHVGIAMNSQE